MRNTKKFWRKQRVLITGGHGFLGSHLVKILKKFSPKEINSPRHVDCDLRDKSNCELAVKNIDLVIHLAANVGGIGYNQKFPGSLFYDNLIMGTQLLEAARKSKVKKFVSLGTICAYPKFTPIPFQEKNLWAGYPEETNAPYGLAKKMLLVQGQAYRQEYAFNSIYLLPVNMYGPADNFNPQSSHVVPALIRKFVNAKKNKQKTVTIWGTGRPTREFLYVKDAAKGILLASEHYDGQDPINLGSSFEISIRELAENIKKLSGFKGKLVFDKSKPDGQARRKLDVSKAKQEFGFESEINFETGLKETIDWYKKHGS
ncbi:MAG: GDP-L-fucose synthase [Patescibacteria group bacterium]